MKGGDGIKKIIIAVILFAITISLIVGVVIPIFNQGRNTGDSAFQNGRQIVDDVENIFN